MRKYELLYIIDAGAGDEVIEKTINDVKALVENNGGKCEEPDKWGVRKYAYPINYKQEGFYCLMNFEAEDAFIATLSEKLNFNKNVVRQMIIAK